MFKLVLYWFREIIREINKNTINKIRIIMNKIIIWIKIIIWNNWVIVIKVK